MLEIVKTCTTHGPLTSDQCYKENGRYSRCKICRNYSQSKDFFSCKVHGMLTIEQVYDQGQCKECTKERVGKYKKNNRAKINARIAQDKLENPEKWEALGKIEYLKKKIKYGKLLSLKKVCQARGITFEQYCAMLEKQDNKCAICNQEETRIDGRTKLTQRLVLDHCHETGKFRGLICCNCNLGVSRFEKNIEWLERALKYLEQGGFNDL